MKINARFVGLIFSGTSPQAPNGRGCHVYPSDYTEVMASVASAISGPIDRQANSEFSLVPDPVYSLRV
jgi:hypothetical protein